MNKPSRTAFFTALSLGLSLGISPLAAQAANDAELAEIRKQLQQMKDAYEQRIVQLEQKLARTEATAAKAETVARDAENSAREANLRPPLASATGAPPAANGFNPEISLLLQGQYRNMKDVPNRRISGFWPTDINEPRGFSVDETELAFSANISPFWRGQVTLALVDSDVEVEEAYFQSLGLGYGLGLKGGRYRSGIGYLNQQHAHAWDFADAPLMYKAMFGQAANYTEDGLQLKWVAPTPMFLEFGAEIANGANYPGTDNNKNGSNAGAVFAHIGDDIGVSNSWLAGISYLDTRAKDRDGSFQAVDGSEATGNFNGKSKTWLADFVWKWAPDGNAKYQNFKLQGEYFYRKEQGSFACLDTAGGGCNGGAGVTSRYDTRQSGWYMQGVYQFSSRWRAGLRYDQLDPGRRDLGANQANLNIANHTPTRTTLMTDYSWDEFSRVRLQFAHDKAMQGVTDNQVWVQYIMSLGAHGAHRF